MLFLVGRHGSSWPKIEFEPRSAIEGRIYLITRAEAALIDNYLVSTQVVYSSDVGQFYCIFFFITETYNAG
jgi:hypothetical protein